MCDHCAEIDYPVAACWKPCYQPRARRIEAGLPVPGRIYNEEDYEAGRIIDTLRHALEERTQTADRLRYENEYLRAKRPLPTLSARPALPAPAPFEGVEL